MRYTVTWALDLDELCDAVNKRLGEGWMLHGDLVATQDGRFLQAMIRDEDDETLQPALTLQQTPEGIPLDSLIQGKPSVLEAADDSEELTKIITALNEDADHERAEPSNNGETL
jgi:hypothetical protein